MIIVVIIIRYNIIFSNKEKETKTAVLRGLGAELIMTIRAFQQRETNSSISKQTMLTFI